MAVLYSKDLIKIEPTIDADGTRTYRRTLLMGVSDRSDQADLAIAAAPMVGALLVAPNFQDLNARVTRVGPVRARDDLHFEVDLEYSTKIDQETRDRQENPNPLSRPYTMSGDFQTRQRPLIKDINGDPVVNKAGQFFVDPIMIEEKLPVLTITKNVASVDFDKIRTYVGRRGSVNSDSFLGWSAGTVKCESITFTGPEVENEVTFWKETTRFVFDEDGWKISVCNVGLYYFTGVEVNGKKRVKPIKDEYGVPVTVPVKLTELGFEADQDDDMNYCEFEYLPERAFSGLGLL